MLPVGKRFHNHDKSQSSVGKLRINGLCSVAMLNSQRVGCLSHVWILQCCFNVLGLKDPQSQVLKSLKTGCEFHEVSNCSKFLLLNRNRICTSCSIYGMVGFFLYPLVMTNIAIEHGH